jgi:hypothetical protein
MLQWLACWFPALLPIRQKIGQTALKCATIQARLINRNYS